MRLFNAPDGQLDRRDLTAWSSPPFDGPFADPGGSPPPTPPPDYHGPLHASWALGGGAAEAAFWAEADAREAASGVYLADLLAGRPAGSPHAGRAAVPATVNPLRFLLENVLRGDGMLVRVRAGAVGPNALRGALARARRLASPHEHLLVQVEAGVADALEPVDVAGGPSGVHWSPAALSDEQTPTPPASEPASGRAREGRFA